MFLVVKKTSSGYLYYNNYRQTGSRETFYAHLFTKELAEKKMEWLKTRTKGKFEIISAREVFCNSWKFDLHKDYNSTEYTIRVNNEAMALERVKLGSLKPNNFEKALSKLKTDCEATIAYNKKAIEDQLRQIAAIEKTIAELKQKNENFINSTQDTTLEGQLKEVVEKYTVPADIVVSVLFTKAE
jgi:hypothetical protein